MTKEESDLIIAEQNKSTEEILEIIDKAKEDFKELCNLQNTKIAELEKENAELKADNDARKFAMAMSEKVEKQLRKENAELTDKCRKLEAQIEKMKCCDNCKKYFDCGSSRYVCEEWELND